MSTDTDRTLAELLVQTTRLGIQLDEIPHLTVLDVGCGVDARLVHFLRGQGAKAEGIDCIVTPEPHLMQGWVLKIGDIPRPTQQYDLVITYCNPCLYDPKIGTKERDSESFSWQATRMLMEMLRVSKKEVRIFPSIKFLDEKCKRLGLRVNHETSEIPFRHEVGCTTEIQQAGQHMFGYRSILYRS